MERDLRPLAIAGATAIVSTGLLAVAIGQGWLGPDVGRGANFCEAGRDWVIRQPANTLSNVGFVVAGLLIAWHVGQRGSMMDGRLGTAMAVLVVLLGPGSAAMHATQSELGGHLDMLSMYLVAAFAAAYATMRWRRGGPLLFGLTFAGGVAFGELVGALPVDVPVVNTPGNTAFGLMLIGAIVLETRVMRRPGVRSQRGHVYAALAALLVAFVIWNVTKTWLCAPTSLVQGHAIWHLLDAVSAYFLYRYYASERAVDTTEPQEPLPSLATQRGSSGSKP
jgi:ceramidase